MVKVDNADWIMSCILSHIINGEYSQQNDLPRCLPRSVIPPVYKILCPPEPFDSIHNEHGEDNFIPAFIALQCE